MKTKFVKKKKREKVPWSDDTKMFLLVHNITCGGNYSYKAHSHYKNVDGSIMLQERFSLVETGKLFSENSVRLESIGSFAKLWKR